MSHENVSRIERIPPRTSLLSEGLTVSRALPYRGRRTIGAWCFLDHLGPKAFDADQGMHVGAHPHTHLQTFTWMIEGEVMHRDSLGSEQILRPGQVNLMTAGSGISHTEDSLHAGKRLHAAQLWIALPASVADCAPAFEHYPQLPVWADGDVQCTLMAGKYGDYTAPTRVHSALLGMELLTDKPEAGITLSLDPSFEYGLMPLEGRITLLGEDGQPLAEVFGKDELAYVPPGLQCIHVQLSSHARVLVLGGIPFTDPLVMWWNFVASSMDAIRSYRQEWESGSPRFGQVPGGEYRRLPAPMLA